MNRILAAAITASLISGSADAAVGPDGPRYVSIGSSYAAGPGVGVPDATSGACSRSMSNYARRIAARHHMDLTDVGCSGATTASVLANGQFGFPAQIEAVTPDTQLVTILVGGNDVAYIPNLLALSCLDQGGTSCGTVVSDTEVDRRLAALPAALLNVIAAVRERAPQAQIIMIGYLPAIPASGPGTCTQVPLTLDDAQRIRSLAIRLARVIGGVASAAGIPVVPASLIGTGHDACATQPFVAGAHPELTPGWPSPVTYHPNQAGMDQIADAISDILTGPGPSQN